MEDIAEHPIWCGVSRIVRIPSISQVPVLVQAPPTGTQIVETYPHLMRYRLVMVARGLCYMTMIRPSTLLVANWSKTAIRLPKNMTIAPMNHPPPPLQVLLPMSLDGHIVNITQLYNTAEAKEQKLERHYAMTKQNTSEKKKH